MNELKQASYKIPCPMNDDCDCGSFHITIRRPVCPVCKGEKYTGQYRKCPDCNDGTLESYLRRQIADLVKENERLKKEAHNEYNAFAAVEKAKEKE